MNDEKQALMPRLRFPEFRDVWCSSPMSERYSFRGNNSLSRDKLNYSEGSLRNIHYGDIHTKFALHFRVDAELVPYINDGESHSAIRPENYCMSGDVVFADASEDMEDIGKAIEVIDTGDVPLVCGLHTILARPDTANFALGFGAYLFSSEGTRKQIQREAQGAKVLGLSASRLGNVKLHYPRSTREQQKIADCLSSLDALIAAQVGKLDALKIHKKGLMQQLFPREGETVPRLRFPEFREAGRWENKPLKKVFSIFQGFAFSSKDATKIGIRWLKIADVGIQYMDSSTPSYLPANHKNEHERFLVRLDDYVIALTRPILGKQLKIAKVDSVYDGALLNQRVGKLVTDENKDFVYYLLQTSQLIGDIEKNIAGNDPPNLSSQQIGDIFVRVPKSDEQQKIADCLSSLDALIAAQADKLDALKAHKKGLMQQLFPSPEAVGA